MNRRVAVVGAGWSGLACSLTLQDGGAQVTLIDAAPQPGGRARRVDVELGDATYALDNGQHLLLGAYSETLRLIARVGLDADQLLLRIPFELRYPDCHSLRAGRWPAPWHLAAALLTARGFSLADRASIVRDLIASKRRGWMVAADVAADELFRFATPEVQRLIWNPLCLAALNVPLREASAQIFLNVLKESLGATAADSQMLIPRCNLSALFPSAALGRLQRAGAEVLLRHAATVLRSRDHGGWTLTLRDRKVDADAVVVALPPAPASALLESTAVPALAPICEQLGAIESVPIATVYLRYPPDARLPAPVFVLNDDPSRQRYGQWVFNRGALDSACAGVMAVVISGSGPHLEISRDELLSAVVCQMADDFALPMPIAGYLLVEKRATIRPCPGLRRPAAELPATGLFLAGDAADSPYPSTIEGSVRAGIEAARAALSV